MKKLLIIVSIIGIILTTHAQIPDPKSNTYVNDLAGVITTEQIELLNKQIRILEDSFTIQLAIVIIPNLPDGYDIERYTLELGRKWHVGNHDNGLIYVVALGDHKQRLEVANRLQGTIPDITAKELTEQIKPYLKNKDYYNGLSDLVGNITKLVTPAKSEQKALATSPKNNDWIWGVFALVVGLGFIGLWYYTWTDNKKRKAEEKRVKDLWDEEDRKIQNQFPEAVKRQGFKLVPKEEYVSEAERRRQQRLRDDEDAERQRKNRDIERQNKETYDTAIYVPSIDVSTSSSPDPSPSYGNWGSDSSSDNSSSDSGVSGGGSSNDF